MSAPELLAAAQQAVQALSEAEPCWHGPAYDSNEAWGNDCSICRAMRPLVLAIKREAMTGPPRRTGADRP